MKAFRRDSFWPKSGRPRPYVFFAKFATRWIIRSVGHSSPALKGVTFASSRVHHFTLVFYFGQPTSPFEEKMQGSLGSDR